MSEPNIDSPAFPVPGAVAYPVPSLGIVRVKGQDAMKVLSGLCTAKIQDLPVGGAKEAFFTDDRGRVLAHALVGRDAEGAWVVGQLAQPEGLTGHVDRFIFREDAAPRNLTATWSGRLVDGSDALLRLAEVVQSDQLILGGLGLGTFQTAGFEVVIIRVPITSPSALLCFVAAEYATAFESALAAAGFDMQRSAEEFETRRIANFWPVAGREISERTLPQELDRDERAISFTKGCYLGQETVARLDAMGEVQRKLCLVRLPIAAAVEAGQSLTRDGKEVGKLTSVAPLPVQGERLALAYMRRGSLVAGTPFEVDNQAGTVIAHAP